MTPIPHTAARFAVAAALAVLCSHAHGMNALGHLRAAPKPTFKQGHTLPPLTRWGWAMPFDVQVELTKHWGYALELGEANAGLVEKLDDPNSVPAKLCALTASDPKRYPLSVLTYRACGNKKFIASLPPDTWCRDAYGKPFEDRRWKQWSPEAPDTVFERAAAEAVKHLKAVRAKAPIAIALNGGEYALSVYGHSGKVWKQDPRVVKAKGERSWYHYISQRKAHQESIITRAVRAALPDRTLYIYYYADGCPHRNRYGGWLTWAWDYKWMKAVSDLPSGSSYYRHYNSGWTGNSDLLTQTLNSITQQTTQGQPLSYNWVCGGWTRKSPDKDFSDDAPYTGYLKCTYTAGMIGGIAGYFAYPKGGFAGDLRDQPPSWLTQMMALGRVHALFSHLEEFLRNGDLLPGPDRHRWSKDLPACEFPTGDPTARVIARKLTTRNEWLLTAWATDGPDRTVAVTIPKLGRVQLQARVQGSVYRATLTQNKPSLKQMDK